MAVARVLLLASVCGGLSAFTPYVTGNPTVWLRWPAREVTWVLDAAAPSDLADADAEAAIRAGFDAWTQLVCDGTPVPFDLRYGGRVAGKAVGFARTGENENLVTWVVTPGAWTGGAAVIALTTLSFSTSTGAIADADVEINDVGFQFDAVAARATLTHEVGHVIGLDHSLEPAAVMYFASDGNTPTKTALLPDDVAGYCALYGPGSPPLPPPALPSTTGGGDAQAATADAVGSDSQATGRSSGCATSPTPSPLGPIALTAAGVWLWAAWRRRRARAPWTPVRAGTP